MTCQDCKHANYYPAYWWYPWLDPYCEIHKVRCVVDMECCDFELIGRLSR